MKFLLIRFVLFCGIVLSTFLSMGQPYLNKVYLYLATGHAPSSILVENDGYLIASWGYTEQSDALFFRSGIILHKIDFQGDTIWRKIYNQPGKTYTISQYGSLIKTFGGYFLSGSERDTITGNLNFYLIKFDKSGNKIFLKTYHKSAKQNCWHGQATADGGYIMTGENITGQQRDYYVLKADSNGNKQWDAVYGGGAGDIAFQVHPIGNKQYLISGVSESFGPGAAGAWLLRVDSMGNELWSNSYGTRGADAFGAASPSSTGYLIWGGGDTLTIPPDKNYNEMIYKIDFNGNIQWRTFFHHQKRRIIWQLRELDDGSIVAIGEQKVGAADSTAGWVAKLNPQGDILWERYYFGNFNLSDSLFNVSSDFWGDFQQTSDGGFIVAGRVYKAPIDYPNSGAFNQLWLVKLDSNGCMGPNDCGLYTGIEEVRSNIQEVSVVVFPNPASEFANVYIKGNSSRWANEQVQITLYNLTGQQMHTQTRLLNYAGYTETKIRTSNLAAGVYIYEITDSKKEILGRGKMVVQ